MTFRRITRVLVGAGLACVLAALLVPGAAAANGGGVMVSVNGAPFTASSSRPLFDTAQLAPGMTAEATLGVRNGLHEPARLRLRVHDLRDDDNGCAGPERRVDTTCGPGAGELGGALQVRVLVTRGDTTGVAWHGTLRDLVRGIDTGVVVRADGQGRIRMTARVPSAAGAAVESDTVGFGLRVVLQGAAGSARAEVGDESAQRPDDSASGSPLAITGLPAALLALAAVLLIGSGVVASVAARRRAQSDAVSRVVSSRARRAPRRAAPP